MKASEGGKANRILQKYLNLHEGTESIFSAEIAPLGITLPLKPDAAMALNSTTDEINIKD